MEYAFLSEVLARGGVQAVKGALEDFADRASKAELDAAVDLACQVIADDTVRISAHTDQADAAVGQLRAAIADLEWQRDMLLGFTIGQLLEPEADSR